MRLFDRRIEQDNAESNIVPDARSGIVRVWNRAGRFPGRVRCGGRRSRHAGRLR
jgi:hypothetical protein